MELLDAGVLKGHVRISAQGRKIAIIEKDSLRNADQYIADLVTLNGAAELLGLPKGRLDELVAAKIIRPRYDGPKDGVNRLFSRAEISKFIMKITSGQHEPSEDEELIFGSVILKTHLAKGEFVRFISDILEKKLPRLRTESMDASFLDASFGKERFFAWRKSVRNSCDTTCTVTEAAHQLGLKQEVAYHLVRTGLLKSRSRPLGKRFALMIEKKHIEHFQTSYVSAVCVAQHWHTTPRSLIAKLSLKNIFPVTGPNIDRCRQYFYKVEDIF